MGRFFETAPTQFVEDFIYQPPWEIIQQNNMLKAQDYATKQQTFNLLDNVPVDSWIEADGELAKAKQEEYRNLAQPLIETFRKDPSNKQAEMQLHDLANKVYKDYTYGDLAKLRTNKEQHDKFLAVAETIKDPQEREIFLRQEGLYLQSNEQGLVNNALTKQFKYMEAQPLRNLPTEFLASDAFKDLKANIDAGGDVKVGDTWLTKTNYSTEELKSKIIQQAYKHWLEGENLDKGNWSRYMTELVGIKDLSDDEGKLRWDDNSYLGKSIKTVGDTYEYKKSTSTKDVAVNEVAENARNRAFEASESEKQFKRNLILANTKSGSSGGSDSDAESNAVAENFKLPEPVRKDIANISKIQGELKEEIEATFGPLAAKTTGSNKVNAMTFYHKLINNSKYWKEKNPLLYNKAANIFNKSNKFSNAGRDTFINIYGEDKVNSYDSKLRAVSKVSDKVKFSVVGANNLVTANTLSLKQLNNVDSIQGVKIAKNSVEIDTTAPINYVYNPNGRNNTKDIIAAIPIKYTDVDKNIHTSLIYTPLSQFDDNLYKK